MTQDQVTELKVAAKAFETSVASGYDTFAPKMKVFDDLLLAALQNGVTYDELVTKIGRVASMRLT